MGHKRKDLNAAVAAADAAAANNMMNMVLISFVFDFVFLYLIRRGWGCITKKFGG